MIPINISESGICCRFKNENEIQKFPFDKDHHLILEVKKLNINLQIECQLVWSIFDSAGLKFTQLDNDKLTRIKQIISIIK